MRTSKRNWIYFAISAAVIAAAVLFVLRVYPQLSGLVWLGVYTIPSHMFVSPFNHEWLLLLIAKSYPAIWCTVVSLIGCLVAGMWDYWLLVPLIHHPRIRRKYSRTGPYRKSVAFFRKWPFWALVVIGLLPIPFYPVKFLAIADKYPLRRYLLALIIGRTPRYYAIAYLGHVLRLPLWSIVALALLLLAIGFIQNRRSENREVPEARGGVEEGLENR
ncbi:MAG: VTT domain-containing protein [Candidatus Latescibacterota bacterium]|nr:MAG: VTT domain-containing protein [Candidatus Latescibacterota bacterium]